MAVLCSGGIAIEMSNSHKPGRADEAERIAQANGWITEEKELLMGRLHRMDLNDPVAVSRAQNMQWTTIHRVCGEISVSRSIGDPDYKNLVPGMKQEDWYFRWPEGHSQVLEADLLIPDPECKVHEITASDEFLVLASDGLWDVVMPVDAVKIIQYALPLPLPLSLSLLLLIVCRVCRCCLQERLPREPIGRRCRRGVVRLGDSFGQQ